MHSGREACVERVVAGRRVVTEPGQLSRAGSNVGRAWRSPKLRDDCRARDHVELARLAVPECVAACRRARVNRHPGVHPYLSGNIQREDIGCVGACTVEQAPPGTVLEPQLALRLILGRRLDAVEVPVRKVTIPDVRGLGGRGRSLTGSRRRRGSRGRRKSRSRR